MTTPTLTRRGFLVALSGTAAVLGLGVGPAAQAAPVHPVFQPSVWVRLTHDGALTITCARSEMGQGVRATVPYIIAAELGADLSRVNIKQAVGDAVYGNQNTDGSTSIRVLYGALREAGAVAREMLIAAAADQWGVPADSLIALKHEVRERSGTRSASFGELVAAASRQPVPRDAPLRPESELVGVGERLPNPDAEAMSTGAGIYGADVVLENMLTAMILRPPALGAPLESFDEAAARAVPGVVDVVQLPPWTDPGRFEPLGGVAVLADHTWAAMKGCEALKPQWGEGVHGPVQTADEYAAMTAALDKKGKRRRKQGNADKALAGAQQTISATYIVPHLEHATMEPLVAVADVREGRCEIWAPTQAPQRTRQWVSKLLKIPEKHVTVNVTHLGGAFGRKGKPDFICEAALLSQHAGRPVRVQWSREDTTRHGYYHACAVQRVDAAFDDQGGILAWRHRVAAPTIASTLVGFLETLVKFELAMGLLDMAIDAPHVSVEVVKTENKVRIGWLRSVYNINHGFAVQSFVGELAEARGVPTPDMLKTVLGPPRTLTKHELGNKVANYGLSHKTHPIEVGRWHAVIDKVRMNAGYDGDPGEGRAFGFAAHLSFNTYVATVVAVTRDSQGQPKVDEAWVVVDAGKVMNPDRVRAQIEGAVIFGISIALHGNITLKDGAVEQSNFHDYPVARMPEAPRAVHVDLASSGGAPGGIGEPGLPPVAPAIANGWARLTGERVRELPMIKRT